jgi:hypothetical protein
MIFAADYDNVLMFGMGLQANIMVGIERLPIEGVGETSTR